MSGIRTVVALGSSRPKGAGRIQRMARNRAAIPIFWVMGDFKRLQVWRKAHALSIRIHLLARRMRGPGIANLRNQLIRAAESIATNIVEGHGQASPKQFARFLGYSLNSGAEVEQHLLTARDLSAIGDSDFRSVLAELIEVRKMTYGLKASLLRPRRGVASAQSTARENNGSQAASDES